MAWIALHGPMGTNDPFQTNQTVAIMEALGANGYPMAAFNRSLIEGDLTTAIAYKEAAFSQAVENVRQDV